MSIFVSTLLSACSSSDNSAQDFRRPAGQDRAAIIESGGAIQYDFAFADLSRWLAIPGFINEPVQHAASSNDYAMSQTMAGNRFNAIVKRFEDMNLDEVTPIRNGSSTLNAGSFSGVFTGETVAVYNSFAGGALATDYGVARLTVVNTPGAQLGSNAWLEVRLVTNGNFTISSVGSSGALPPGGSYFTYSRGGTMAGDVKWANGNYYIQNGTGAINGWFIVAKPN